MGYTKSTIRIDMLVYVYVYVTFMPCWYAVLYINVTQPALVKQQRKSFLPHADSSTRGLVEGKQIDFQ